MSEVEPMSDDKEIDMLHHWASCNQRFSMPPEMLSRLLARLDALQAVVDRLPKTADGVPVVDDMDLWLTIGDRVERHTSVVGVYVSYETPMPIDSCVFSTRAAAEAARKERGDADV